MIDAPKKARSEVKMRQLFSYRSNLEFCNKVTYFFPVKSNLRWVTVSLHPRR
ncbi:uncharacterized protein PHALS_10901 [Plasmopara halstedii]|uniref:Uncharacterized protein n=1 Tax=Plasmopara halstedii TaxID=4781 RepID=A0A0P1AIV3_PLAHL|nr:uncharacterized protein PHALS_10901 [Plasmopara halstedii]CEG40717.1 hypothetical protein PHALS_10901 [Plasmopara halstedii]|eukprot:XP_024577086.1 hypothetical protein PHALS_10901 [Plasmopara halstedii]